MSRRNLIGLFVVFAFGFSACTVSAGDDLKAEIEKLRAEIAKLRAEVKETRKPKADPMYQGKPLSHWVEQLRDADEKYGLDALAAIGKLALHNQGLAREQKLVALLASIVRNDSNESIKVAAIEALRFCGEDAVPQLVAVAEDKRKENETLRYVSIMNLTRMGATAKDAIPFFVRLIGDPVFQHEAIQGLKAQGPRASAELPTIVRALEISLDDFANQPRTTASPALRSIAESIIAIDPKAAKLIPDYPEFVESEWRDAVAKLKKKYGQPK